MVKVHDLAVAIGAAIGDTAAEKKAFTEAIQRLLPSIDEKRGYRGVGSRSEPALILDLQDGVPCRTSPSERKYYAPKDGVCAAVAAGLRSIALEMVNQSINNTISLEPGGSVG